MKRALWVALMSLGLSVDAQAQVPQSPAAMTLAEIAAVKIKGEEAGAKNRRAAVHYLGTLEWHYYPEAEDALVAALRADRNEQVRLEAAQALGLHQCTKRGIDALNIVLAGNESDGNPAEISEKVKVVARVALQHSLPRYGESPRLEIISKRPEAGQVPSAMPTPLQLTSYSDERVFAETIGAPKAPLNVPKMPRNPTRAPAVSTGLSGLAPLGFIPRQ
jgi:tRNA(Leu) C34 or U34 (ribose-2'-O)-methylase TrmL